MSTKELIEDIIIKELRGICTKCTHADDCPYTRNTGRGVIQCEQFEVDHNKHEELEHHAPRGLCKNCDHAALCNLPGRIVGVWHCNEYK